jgi:hypothetical protein
MVEDTKKVRNLTALHERITPFAFVLFEPLDTHFLGFGHCWATPSETRGRRWLLALRCWWWRRKAIAVAALCPTSDMLLFFLQSIELVVQQAIAVAALCPTSDMLLFFLQSIELVVQHSQLNTVSSIFKRG